MAKYIKPIDGKSIKKPPAKWPNLLTNQVLVSTCKYNLKITF